MPQRKAAGKGGAAQAVEDEGWTEEGWQQDEWSNADWQEGWPEGGNADVALADEEAESYFTSQRDQLLADASGAPATESEPPPRP